MFTTAFRKGGFLFKRTMSIRKELSILGFILLLPHFLIFLIGDYQYLEWVGIISAVIMVPLFITSFTYIRKMFSYQDWMDIQYFAYHAYALMFLHLFIVAENSHRVVYGIILLWYMVLKLINEPFKRINSPSKLVFLLATIATSVSLTAYNNTDLSVKKTEPEILVYEEVTPPSEDSSNEVNNEVVSAQDDNQKSESTTKSEANEDTKTTTTSGVYEGSAVGFKSRNVDVVVSIEDDIIKSIDIVNCGCTAPHKIDYEVAVKSVATDIIKNNSTEVDLVSGATYSTRGLVNAVNDAISKSK